jgi:hypothetical protein
VVLHRIPASLYIWGQLSKILNFKLAVFIYILLGLAFVIGFLQGSSIQSFVYVSAKIIGALQALLAGGILHSAFHSNVIHHD